LPFQSQIENAFASSVLDYGNVTVSNLSITPEARFYILGGMRGFYIAPYARFATMDLNVPIRYSNSSSGSLNKEADFVGKITSTSGGVMIGTQHQLFKKIVIDIWIIGGHYGSSHGDINATYTPTDPNNPLVTHYEKQSIQNGINSINPAPFKVSGTVSQTTPTAHITVDGPWAGIRALGINVGVRF
jgi:hypothetical protein